MELGKLQQLRQKVHDDIALRIQLKLAASEHEDAHLDDRAFFDAVVAPIACKAGIQLSYEEAAAELYEERELSDEELENVAGGVGIMYRRLIGGMLATTMVVSSLPTRAIAEELQAKSDGMGDSSIALVQDEELKADSGDPTSLGMGDQGLEVASVGKTAPEDIAPVDSAGVAVDADQTIALATAQDDIATQAAVADQQDVLAGIDGHAADISMADVALPQGLTATNDGIVLTGDVTSAVAAAIEQSGAVATDTTGVAYEVGKLGYVDNTAQQVKALGSGIFDVVVAGTSGYAKVGAVGIQKLLQLAGVIGSKDTVTPELLSQMKQLNALMQNMSKQLDENTKQTYQNRLTVFDNAVGALNIECGTMEAMYRKGYALAEQRGLLKTADENGGVSSVLVKLMRDEDAKGNADFRDFSTLMNGIRTNYETVAVECAKEGGASPFYAFDSYWALYFNFDTQGYYLRQAYRTNAELQLKRSYTLLALYYNLPQTLDAGKDAEPMTAALQAALKSIEAQPAGVSPEAAFYSKNQSGTGLIFQKPIHCYVTGRDYWRTLLRDNMACADPASFFTDDQAKAFCERLHGRTVAEDLRLAGIMNDWDPAWNVWLEKNGKDFRVRKDQYVGLGLHENPKDHDISYYLPFDATSYTPRQLRGHGTYMVTLDVQNHLNR